MSIWKRYTDEEKKKILEEFKKSTEGQKVFCKRKKMSPTTLRTWLKESKETQRHTNSKNKTTDFGIIHLTEIGKKSKETVALKELEEIFFKTDNIEIRLNKGYDKEMLQKIIEVFAYAK